MTENSEKTSELTTNEKRDDVEDKDNKTSTLKSVKRKIRKLTFRRNEKPQIIEDEKSDKVENSSDESIEKGKFTFKKIFRKSSFRKIISNISQQFTHFTVSTELAHSFISFIHLDQTKIK